MSIIDPRFTKAVSSSLTVQAETLDNKIISGSDLLFTVCNRSSVADNKGNYFVSFNLPTDSTELSTGSTVAKYFPELYQLNNDKIVFCSIPPTQYSEYIDGRSITLFVPTGGSNPASVTGIKLYSSTYTSDKPLKYGETSPLLGDNVCYLFSDSINKPYTGYTADELGVRKNMSANTTWEPDPTDYTKRPSAVSYREVLGGGVSALLNQNNTPNGLNSDTRTGSYSITPPTNFPDGIAGYNYDVPVGFCYLDMGICVITHSAITNNIAWSLGTLANGGTLLNDSGRTNVYFTGTQANGDPAAYLEYTDINTSFKTTAVCLAMPTEFWISNNSTWNRASALNNLNSQTGILTIDPIYVTEVGLYNQLNELVAVAKMSEYVEKNYINLITFNIDIDM
jgi:hypothetical protein